MLSYLRLPLFKKKKKAVKTSVSQFSNQGIRTLLFLRCLLLAADSPLCKVQCTGGSCPFKATTVPAGERGKWARDFFKLLPPRLPHFTCAPTSLLLSGPGAARASQQSLVSCRSKRFPGTERTDPTQNSTGVVSDEWAPT